MKLEIILCMYVYDLMASPAQLISSNYESTLPLSRDIFSSCSQ